MLAGLATCLAVAACGAGFGASEPEVDRTVVTGALSGEAPPANGDAARSSDITTIRNAVSSADLEEAAGQPLAWANSDTGSRGSISALVQYTDQGTLCRRFQATRESFDGVALFKGDACQAGQGAWRIRAFDAF
jgi:surface antigen